MKRIKLGDLNRRKRAAVEYAARHGVVSAALARAAAFDGLTDESADKELRGLRRTGLLDLFEDHYGVRYYLPTERLFTALNRHRWAGRDRGADTVARRVAAASVAAEAGMNRLTAREFREALPHLYDRKTPSGYYYLDLAADPQRIGWLEVDTGRDVRRLRKVDRVFRRRLELAAWSPIVRAGQFTVLLAVPSEGRRRVIDLRLPNSPCRDLPVSVVVVDALQGILLKE